MKFYFYTDDLQNYEEINSKNILEAKEIFLSKLNSLNNGIKKYKFVTEASPQVIFYEKEDFVKNLGFKTIII